MHKTLKSALLMVSFAVLVGGIGAAYAEIVSTPQDDAIIIVAAASLVGSIFAPLYGWLSSEKTGGKLEPFDRSQYIKALMILIPANLAVVSAQVVTLDIQVLTLQSVIALFITTFLGAVGIDTIKARR